MKRAAGVKTRSEWLDMADALKATDAQQFHALELAHEFLDAADDEPALCALLRRFKGEDATVTKYML